MKTDMLNCIEILEQTVVVPSRVDYSMPNMSFRCFLGGNPTLTSRLCAVLIRLNTKCQYNINSQGVGL